MINLCRGGRGVEEHDEICYEGSRCPLCDMREELSGVIEELKERIESLEKEE